MSIYDNKLELLNSLGINENFLYSSFSNKYKIKSLKKKDGGERKIKPPISKLKTIQRKILDDIIIKVKPLDCVYGLSKEKDVRNNGIFHSRNWDKDVLCLDIIDFFGNINYKNIKKVYKRIGFNKENANILTKLSTIDKTLPQGSPLSSHLSSLAVMEMDFEIIEKIKQYGLIYSRYVDDVTISGKVIRDSHIKEIKTIINNYNFKTKDEKEKLYRNEDKKIVTGVKLIGNNNVTVTDRYEKDLVESFDINSFLKKDKVFMGKVGYFKYLNKRKAKEFIKKILEVWQ